MLRHIGLQPRNGLQWVGMRDGHTIFSVPLHKDGRRAPHKENLFLQASCCPVAQSCCASPQPEQHGRRSIRGFRSINENKRNEAPIMLSVVR